MTDAVDILVDRLGGLKPDVAIVLGSGLGALAGEVEDAVRIPYARPAGLSEERRHRPCRRGGRRRFRRRPVLLLAGRAHYYEHGDAAVMRPALEALAGIGIDKLILTNAAGSLDRTCRPARSC